MQKLYRAIGTITSEENSRKIHGLAIPVDVKSVLLPAEGVHETILRDAVNEDLIKNNDVNLILNHNPNLGVFARSKYGEGSLKLMVTDLGLEFETELPETEQCNQLLEGIKRGDFDAVSFCYDNYPEDEYYDKIPNPDGSWNRYVKKIHALYEISILSVLPAYSDTNVQLRSLEKVKEEYKNKLKEKYSKMREEIEEISKI